MEPTSRAQRSFEEEAEALLQRAVRTRGSAAAAFFLEAAEVYGGKLGRRDRAILCFQQATRADPEDASLPQQLRRELFAQHRYRAVFASLEREREQRGGAALAEDYLALAEALVDDPTEHQLARTALHWARLLQEDTQRTRAVEEALAALDAGWRQRATALWAASLAEQQAAHAAELSLAVARLFSWYDPGGSARVKEALDRCFVLWPAMPGALRFLERMAERTEDWASFATVLEHMARDASEPAAQAELWVRAGTLRLSRLRDAPGALADFRQATAAEPGRADAVSLAAELLLETEHDVHLGQRIPLFEITWRRERRDALEVDLRHLSHDRAHAFKNRLVGHCVGFSPVRSLTQSGQPSGLLKSHSNSILPSLSSIILKPCLG